MCNKKCVLSDKGTLKELMKFNLYETNLPYKECQNFQKIIKRFVEKVGIKNLINVAETVPQSIGADHAAAINNAYQKYKIFKYKGYEYYISFTLINNDGTVEYDSSKGTTEATAALEQLHTTIMEFQRASETRWGCSIKRIDDHLRITRICCYLDPKFNFKKLSK